jgi:hypothetical protein
MTNPWDDLVIDLAQAAKLNPEDFARPLISPPLIPLRLEPKKRNP